MDEGRRDRVRHLLATSRVLGAEVDLRYRVLALTIEPPPDRLAPSGQPGDHGLLAQHDGEGDGGDGDRRLQVLLHPVGTIAAALVRHDPGPPPRGTVLTFEPADLPEVVAALDEPVPHADPFPRDLPDLDAMERHLSFRGAAQVAGGHRHPFTMALAHDDLTLDLWATFDDVEVRLPDGRELDGSTTSPDDAGPHAGRGGDHGQSR